MNDKGSVLPTVLVLMLVLAGLLTGTTFILRNQVQQLTLTQNSYRVRTMVEVAETIFLETRKEETASMTVAFNEGVVVIEQKEQAVYTLKGQLENGYSYEKKLNLPTDTSQEESTASPSDQSGTD